jgi:hypothetical protein
MTVNVDEYTDEDGAARQLHSGLENIAPRAHDYSLLRICKDCVNFVAVDAASRHRDRSVSPNDVISKRLSGHVGAFWD